MSGQSRIYFLNSKMLIVVLILLPTIKLYKDVKNDRRHGSQFFFAQNILIIEKSVWGTFLSAAG